MLLSQMQNTKDKDCCKD